MLTYRKVLGERVARVAKSILVEGNEGFWVPSG